MIPEFKPMSFEEWVRLNPDIANQTVDCKNCSGEGEVTCPCCDHTSECPDCDGTGKQGDDIRAIYNEMIAKDRAAYEKYYGLPRTFNPFVINDGADEEQQPLIFSIRK